MAGTALARHGKDTVDVETGEVVASSTFDMADYLGSVSSAPALAHQKQLAAAYDAACASLIGENDVQKEGGRTFKKKSAWRKLARHFNISTGVVRVERDIVGENFLATVIVRATGPWGQSAESVGACGTDEAVGRRVITIADAIATAETRATNRAVSNLIAMGEVSAEEMTKGNDTPRQGAQSTGGNESRGPVTVMPFGDHKGKALSELGETYLQSTADWCREKGKFDDLRVACEQEIAQRHEQEEAIADAHQASDAEMPF
jgi:uncharacterized protein (DUF3820 family)